MWRKRISEFWSKLLSKLTIKFRKNRLSDSDKIDYQIHNSDPVPESRSDSKSRVKSAV
eukprot:COSAG01_NODE_72510_length_252_cov_10.954248_1_plen_57_part_01